MSLKNISASESTMVNDTPKESILQSDLSDTKVLECGPLEYMMPCSCSKILDFLLVYRNFDYSISDIAKHSGLSFKTCLNEVRKLEAENYILNSRNVGKAIMFKINTDSQQVKTLAKLATEIATARISKSI